MQTAAECGISPVKMHRLQMIKLLNNMATWGCSLHWRHWHLENVQGETTSGRSDFRSCRAATVEQSPGRNATTRLILLIIPSGAKDEFVLLMAAAPCECFLAPL